MFLVSIGHTNNIEQAPTDYNSGHLNDTQQDTTDSNSDHQNDTEQATMIISGLIV